ncbi:MAG: hypothetical protein IH899_05005 [Planctomycetes bacterium]|nr:hypothetical protein [Planctomycetota bacterium]
MTARGISGEFSPQLTWTGRKATLEAFGVGMLPAGESAVQDITLMNAQYYPGRGNRNTFSGSRRGSRSTSFSDSPDDWPAEEREFVLEPGRVNEWKIVLPEWMIKRIRLSIRVAEALKAQESG